MCDYAVCARYKFSFHTIIIIIIIIMFLQLLCVFFFMFFFVFGQLSVCFMLCCPVTRTNKLNNLTDCENKVSRISQFVVEITTLLVKIACHMGSHSVTCHLAAVTFPPLHQPKLVLEGCKAELTWYM